MAKGIVAVLATAEDKIADPDMKTLAAQDKNRVITAIESLLIISYNIFY